MSRKYGLFHLKHIRTQKEDRNPMADFLFKCVRECADREQGRDIPLEDFCRSVLSFHQAHDSIFLLRFSVVNHIGQPHGNVSVAETLHDVTLALLKGAGWTVLGCRDADPRYDHYYNAASMAATEYLYVPDNKYVQTYVVIKKGKRYALALHSLPRYTNKPPATSG